MIQSNHTKFMSFLKMLKQKKGAFYFYIGCVRISVGFRIGLWNWKNGNIRFDKLLIKMPIFHVENLTTIQNFILDAKQSKYDLSDLLIVQAAKTNGCEKVLTFD